MRRPLAALAAAALGAALAYGPSLDGEFQFDDWTSIQVNWAIRDPARLVGALGPSDLLGPGRPVTELSFALDHALGGIRPIGFHLTSLALHVVATLLAFLLLRDALRRVGHARADGVAAFAAGAFALPPLQTESVCYAAQRAELLSSVLYLAAFLLLLRARDAWPRAPAWAWAGGATVALALALGAKPIAVTLPAAFLLHAVVLAGDPGALRVGRRAARALAVGAGAWALSIAAIVKNLTQLGPASGAGLSAGDLGAWRYLLTQLRVEWLYARLLVWPAGQSVDRSFAASPGLFHGPTIAAALATAALLALAASLWRRAERGAAPSAARAVAFGIAWWLLLLAPTSSVVPIADLVAEHRVYLALLGPLVALAVAADLALSRLAPARARALGLALAAGVWAGLGGALAARAQLWRSQLALWADAAAVSPDSSRVVGNYAYALHASGARDAALPVYARALALARTPHEVATTARNLSVLYYKTGQLDRALAVVDMGLAADAHDFELRTSRALVLRSLLRVEEAIVEATRAVALADQPQTHDTLGLVLLMRPDPAAALAEFRAARLLDPERRLYADHEILALARLGRRAEACAAWSALLARGGPEDATTPGAAAALGCGAPGQ